MGPIALSFVRQIWWRHNRGLATSALGLLAIALVMPPVHDWIVRTWPDPEKGQELAIGIIGTFPILVLMLYMASIFIMAAGQLGDMTSGYSPRMFTLPVRTATLVAWPMILGAVAVCMTWAALALLVFRRCGFDTPIWHPMLWIVAFLWWVQALSWTPFRFGWIGVFLSSLVIAGQFLAWAWMRGIWGFPMGWMSAIVVVSCAVAWAVALRGVARDRRGDGREVPRWWAWLGEAAARRWRTRAPFRSAEAAQFHFEWWNSGLAVPIFTIFLMALVIPLFAFGRRIEHDLLWKILLTQFALPAILTASFGSALTRYAPFWSPRSDCFPFVATRPMTSRAIVAAKFRTATWSILAAYAVTALGLTAMILAGGYGPEVARMARDLRAAAPGGRAVGLAILVVMLALVVSWRQSTSSLAAGLTGEKVLMDLGVWIFMGLVAVAIGGGIWLASHPAYVPLAKQALTWAIGAAAVAKLAGSSLAFVAAVRRRLMTPGDAALAVAIWSAVAASLVGLTAWAVPRDFLPIPAPAVWILLAFLVPLGRVAISPLAVEWNRHR